MQESKTAAPLTVGKQERFFEYDFVRVIAMVFVVAVHALVKIDFADPGSLFYFQVMQAAFFTCNGMFFMLSGRFALTARSDYFKYYLGKVKTILVPMLVFFALRSGYQMHLGADAPGGFFRKFLMDILNGHNATEYWFLYVLIGNLLLAPLLARAFESFGKKEHIIFLSVVLCHHLLLTVLNQCGIAYTYTMIFSGWSFYFYLGYSAEKLLTVAGKAKVWLLLAGVACLALTTLLKYKGLVVYVHDLSPLFTVITVCTYFLLLAAGRKITSAGVRKVIGWMARHSFSVYLVHMMVLETVGRHLPAVSGLLSVPNHWGVTLLTLVISLVLAAAADYTVIRLLQMLVDQCKKIKEKQ